MLYNGHRECTRVVESGMGTTSMIAVLCSQYSVLTILLPANVAIFTVTHPFWHETKKSCQQTKKAFNNRNLDKDDLA